MRLIFAFVLCILSAAAFAQPVVKSYDFSEWPLSDWRLVREARFPSIGQFLKTPDGITNDVPAGSAEKAVVGMTGGLGFACGIISDLTIRDCTIRCELAFERKGAPAIMLRTQVAGDVTGDTLCLVLYERGVNLWRYCEGKWSKVCAADFPLAEKVTHRLEVCLEGSKVAIRVDGKLAVMAKDVSELRPGAVGIWAGEGPCRFESFQVRYVPGG